MQIAGPSHMAEQHVAQRTGPKLGLTGFVFVVVVNVALTDPYAWGQNAKLSEAKLPEEPNSVKGFVSPTFAFGGQSQEIDALMTAGVQLLRQSRSFLLDRNAPILGWDSSDGAHINMLSRMSPYYL
ncbi:hypothetical protein ASPFODRAFT_35995 [Aspergillus luchuensis CBS 106.47]|uniref:Uncharacterized protein n=1 Tax=Aspergillus luchuensis (strain CBS 106.47) TaxID=1137211 RepID=A0A1M3T9Q0_ASPLC|nr:hypothetical protein ASPFODRAFT_35995 [Aspergillus luchuensis CBS 106.47]